MKNILITGSSGYIGRNLIKSLADKKYNVLGVDKYNTISTSNSHNIFIEQEINSKLLQKLHETGVGKIHIVIHLASQLNNRQGLTYSDFYEGNVKTIFSMVDIVKMFDVDCFMNVSTCSVFGLPKNGDVLNEDYPVSPVDYYGLTKYLGEKTLEIELSGQKVRLINFRLTSVFGNDDNYGLIHTFYKALKKNEDIELFSKGELFRNFIYISDLVLLFNRIIESYDTINEHGLFIIGSKESEMIITIVEEMKNIMNSKSKIIPVDKKARLEFDTFIDISKASNVFDFSPSIIKEGLKKYISI